LARAVLEQKSVSSLGIHRRYDSHKVIGLHFDIKLVWDVFFDFCPGRGLLAREVEGGGLGIRTSYVAGARGNQRGFFTLFLL
jgi:hypothetical protein